MWRRGQRQTSSNITVTYYYVSHHLLSFLFFKSHTKDPRSKNQSQPHEINLLGVPLPNTSNRHHLRPHISIHTNTHATMMNSMRQALLRNSRVLPRSILSVRPNHANKTRCIVVGRCLSTSTTTTNYDSSALDNLIPSPPVKLTVEMAEGIADATHFYIKHGVSSQRLKVLAQQDDMPVVVKWQKMTETFLTTQIHVIAGMGYTADEPGLTKYAQDMARCMQDADDVMRDVCTELRRDTWRDLVMAAFDLEEKQLVTLSIVDARNTMHKVASKMREPDVLAEIRSRCAELPQQADPQLDMMQRHGVVRLLARQCFFFDTYHSEIEKAHKNCFVSLSPSLLRACVAPRSYREHSLFVGKSFSGGRRWLWNRSRWIRHSSMRHE